MRQQEEQQLEQSLDTLWREVDAELQRLETTDPKYSKIETPKLLLARILFDAIKQLSQLAETNPSIIKTEHIAFFSAMWNDVKKMKRSRWAAEPTSASHLPATLKLSEVVTALESEITRLQLNDKGYAKNQLFLTPKLALFQVALSRVKELQGSFSGTTMSARDTRNVLQGLKQLLRAIYFLRRFKSDVSS